MKDKKEEREGSILWQIQSETQTFSSLWLFDISISLADQFSCVRKMFL